MKAIGRIFTGIILGFILSIIIGSVILQGVLFQQGADMLGVGTWGMYYFVGGFIASCVLMCFPGARTRVSLIGLYPIAVVIVGALAFNANVMDLAGTASDDPVDRITRTFHDMAELMSQIVFWATPTLVTFAYACMYYAHVTPFDKQQEHTQP